jgi:hypothetical protein
VCFFADGATTPYLRGLDIAVDALSRALRLRQVDTPVEFVVHNLPNDDELRRWLTARTARSRLTVTIAPQPADDTWLDDALATASLVVMPHRGGGFAPVGLEALEQGTPMLISGRTGLGAQIRRLTDATQTVLDVSDDDTDVPRWAATIANVLENPVAAAQRAHRLRIALAGAQDWGAVLQPMLEQLLAES